MDEEERATLSQGCVEIMMCGRMEAGGDYRGEDTMLFLSQLFEAAGFSCHIQKEDSVEVGQVREKGMLDVTKTQPVLVCGCMCMCGHFTASFSNAGRSAVLRNRPTATQTQHQSTVSDNWEWSAHIIITRHPGASKGSAH